MAGVSRTGRKAPRLGAPGLENFRTSRHSKTPRSGRHLAQPTQALAIQSHLVELLRHVGPAQQAAKLALGWVSTEHFVEHSPHLSDVINMLALLAAAVGSCALLAAKYVHESGLRRQQYLDDLADEPAPAQMVCGVDVTGSRFLGRPEVVRAAEFAAAAHAHQHRRTGEPYVNHCIATAVIVEGLLASSRVQEADERAQVAVTAALLHDVVDDTTVELSEIATKFGPHVAEIIHFVSRLSDVNQLLRRQLRHEASGSTTASEPGKGALHREDVEALRSMILCLVEEPLVLVVKLADRLHNMRTCHVLKPDRRTALATETLQVWCGLAERLGMFPLKAELEDLSYAVLHPSKYCQGFRGPVPFTAGSSQELEQARGLGVILAADFDPEQLPAGSTRSERDGGATASTSGRAVSLSEEQLAVGEMLGSVMPFHATTFRNPQWMAPSACLAMQALEDAARHLTQELRQSYVAVGLDIDVQGRLKSVYSVHRKMQRKQVPVDHVYDARALRLVIDDQNGMMLQDAVEACYDAVRVVHRLWKPIKGECDDYIANPSPSGYQSLHTAVRGPGAVPMEVQIRTSSMHSIAEYGAAAHWAYKDSAPPTRGQSSAAPRSSQIRKGQPVMRADGGRLQLGVVIDPHTEEAGKGRGLLIAVKNGSRLLPGAQIAPEECREVVDYVARQQWDHAGAGDWNVRLEACRLCSDGKFHIVDFFGRRLRATATPIIGWPPSNTQPNPLDTVDDTLAAPRLSSTPWQPPAAVGPLAQLSSPQDSLDMTQLLSKGIKAVLPPQARKKETEGAQSEEKGLVDLLNAPKQKGNAAKIRSLRRKLENAPVGREVEDAVRAESSQRQHISVFVWPFGKVVSLPRGITAGQVLKTRGAIEICQEGVESSEGLVNVNNKLVPDSTPLKNGDYIVLSRHLININKTGST
ncbi:hypothetical protein WJX73_010236 [Symbiochloris irregularis]|uniref:GTP diphosphokinase n=1 Tax=Symbiochloris irregularis TaxID=706552 RepID=A0AAW1NNB2_9CHLO